MRNSYFQDPLDPSRRYGRVCASLASPLVAKIPESSYFSSPFFHWLQARQRRGKP